jgi:hypothetical protein
VHFPDWEVCNEEATWADFFGPSSLHANLSWIDPGNAYFHLRHEFAGITPMDAECNATGEPDTTDWHCIMLDYHEDRVAGPPSQPPVETALYPACPNPASEDVSEPVILTYTIPAAMSVEVFVVDTAGERIRTLLNDLRPAGIHQLSWDHRDDAGQLVPPGLVRAFLRARLPGDEWYDQCAGDVQIPAPTAAPVVAVLAPELISLPNPFGRSGGTRLFGELPRADVVDLTIFDVAGRRVRTLARDAVVDVGRHPWTWDARDDSGRLVSAGIYFARLTGRETTVTRKLVLLD